MRSCLGRRVYGKRPPRNGFSLFTARNKATKVYCMFSSLRRGFLLRGKSDVTLVIPVFAPCVRVPRLAHCSCSILGVPTDALGRRKLRA